MSQQAQTTTKADGSISIETKLTMTVTDLARAKLDQFLGEERSLDDHGVRIRVEPGGCSGAQYSMEYGGEVKDGELELVANGTRLWILPDHAPLLNGLVIDFVDELMGGGFKIHNPNAKSSCGCGKSFSA